MAGNGRPSALFVDESNPVGSSPGTDGRNQLHVKTFPFGPPLSEYDAVTCVQVDATTVAYEFRQGGIAGSIVQTITMDYGTPTPISFVSVLYS